MGNKGFGRYLQEDHRAKGFQALAAERRERIRQAAERGVLTFDGSGRAIDPLAVDPLPTTQQPASETPPRTTRLTAEGARAGERGNENGFGKYVSGDAPAGETGAAGREGNSPTAGRGFGRYL